MYQSGSKTNHSKYFCLAQLIDFVSTGIDKQIYTGMISVNLQKAFDTLEPGVLLEKMNNFGLQTSVIKWFESYLSIKIFLLCINNVFSEAGTLNTVYHKALFLGHSFFYYM